MLYDSLAIRRLITELRELCGVRVQRTFPLGRLEFVLEMHSRRPLPQIIISGAADSGRVHRDDDLTPVPGLVVPLGDVIRRHLLGATLAQVSQWQFDRCLRLDFINCEGLGPGSRRSLVAEIMGRHSNVLLLDEDGVILECARHVHADMNRVRQFLPGETYIPPPDFDKLDPSLADVEQLTARLPKDPVPLEKWLRATLQGGSDLFLNWVSAHFKGPKDAADLTPDTLVALLEIIGEMIERATAPGEGFIITGSVRRPAAWPLTAPQWEVMATCESLSEAMSALMRRATHDQAEEQLRRRITGALGPELKKARNRERERKEALQQAEAADTLREAGELLLAHLHLMAPRRQEVTVSDYYHDGAPRVITLNPRLDPQENAQAYFSRYKKARRVQERVPPLLAAARRQREYIEDVLEQAEGADLEALQLLEQELLAEGLLKAPRRPRPQVQAGPRRQNIGGYAVLYGRSGLENDAVLREANPDDVWLHVRGAPGGHVVIRTDGRPDDVPQEVLLEAGRLAAQMSKRRNDSAADVDYTPARNVSRLKGTPPGYVHYRRYKTMRVELAG